MHGAFGIWRLLNLPLAEIEMHFNSLFRDRCRPLISLRHNFNLNLEDKVCLSEPDPFSAPLQGNGCQFWPPNKLFLTYWNRICSFKASPFRGKIINHVQLLVFTSPLNTAQLGCHLYAVSKLFEDRSWAVIDDLKLPKSTKIVVSYYGFQNRHFTKDSN